MKPEVGKLYRTHGGLTARIYAIDGHGQFPVHGAIQAPHGGYFMNGLLTAESLAIEGLEREIDRATCG